VFAVKYPSTRRGIAGGLFSCKDGQESVGHALKRHRTEPSFDRGWAEGECGFTGQKSVSQFIRGVVMNDEGHRPKALFARRVRVVLDES